MSKILAAILSFLIVSTAFAGPPIIWGPNKAQLLPTATQLCFPDATCMSTAGVTSVSGTAPITSSGGATPAIGINAAMNQERFVEKSGSDANDCSIIKPCLTIQAAETSCSTPSASNKCLVWIGPGTYAEGNTTLLRDFIYLRGVTRNTVNITGAVTYTWGSASGTVSGIQDVTLGALTFSPPSVASGLTRNSNFNFDILNSMVGNVVWNGTGIISPLNPGVQVYESQIGSWTTHGPAGNNIFRSSVIGITVDDTAFLSSSLFDNSTVISTSIGGGTITTQASKNFPVDGSTAGTTGGGRIRVWTSSGPAAPQRAVITYTAYSAGTGVFSGLTFNSGTLASIVAGDIITNQDGGSSQFHSVRNSSGATDLAAGTNFTSAILTERSGLRAAPLTVNGLYAQVTTDVNQIGGSATPFTFLNGATEVANIFKSNTPRGLKYTPVTSGDWPTQPTTGQEGLDFLASTRLLRAGDTMTGALNINGSANAVQLKVKRFDAQASDIQQWLSDTNSVLAKVDTSGNISGTNLSGTNTGDATTSSSGLSFAGQVLSLNPNAENRTISNFTATTTLTLIQGYVTLDATGASFIATLPPCNSSADGHVYKLKRTNAGANTPTIGADGTDTIDGSGSYGFTSQNEAIEINCRNPGVWFIF